ncbi:1,4-alpha-glucan branching protein GlgB [Hoeflea sp.]|uniref:1,4-alpha-glucan branching protein GlgB n=1 Tax=Hoeflea sp. TaxID=1940281 RepID=UPI003BAEC27A
MTGPQASRAAASETPYAPQTDPAALEAIVKGEHGDPFAVLGSHPCDEGWAVRIFAPGADAADIDDGVSGRQPMGQLHPAGVFGALLTDKPGRYSIVARNASAEWRFIDPYQFGPVLGEMDEHLISEGAHRRLWRTLGARPMTHEGIEGVTFAVWAPNARRISVIGDFNDWDGRRHPMRPRGATGVWELFIPNLAPGLRYKYEIAGSEGGLPHIKSDPVGFQSETRPENSSVVRSLDDYTWHDETWMEERGDRQAADAPISIYEVHLGSWRRRPDGTWLSYRELGEKLVPYVKELGFTHIECLPISEHPLDVSWGYQPIGLYAPTSRFGQLDDFRSFVDACHAAELGLIVDWVPAHFPTDAHGLSKFDGTALYEHADSREGYHPDWNTLIYNLGRPEVSNFLIANALYWTEEHHIDALRVDAVASMLYRDYSRKDGEWIPNRHGGRENLESIDFLRNLNLTVNETTPEAMVIAEESTAWPGVSRPVADGGLGFGFKWNMGWMHDTLEYMAENPMHREHHHSKMSFGLSYAFSENFILSLSHDEVVHGKGSLLSKMPGDLASKLANLRVYYAFMWAHPGKKLLFMGQEFGQPNEWDSDGELDWDAQKEHGHAGLSRLVKDLNTAYREMPALHDRDCTEDGFEWIDGSAEAANVYAWLRKGEDGAPPVLAVFNFSGVEHTGWRLGVPQSGFWRETMNSDAEVYGGGGRGNMGGVKSSPEPSHGHPHSITLTLPPLSGLYLTPEAA